VIPGKTYTPEDIVRIGWRRKWWAVLPAIVIATSVAVWVRTLPNLYHSETLILVVPQRVPESYVRSTITTRIEDRLQSIAQQILSRTRLERIIQDFNLYVPERRTAIMEDIVDRMRKEIEVQVVKGDAFRVGFTSSDARTAMRVTERLASLFIEENLRDREVLAEGTNQFLEAQLEDARRRLVENEKRLEEYRTQHSGELPTQLEANIQGQHNIEMQLQALLESVNRDRDRRLTLERILADAGTPEPVGASSAPRGGTMSADGVPSGATAADQLQATQGALQALRLRLKPEHPDVVRMERLVADLQKKADAEALARPVSAGPARLTPAEIAQRNRLADTKAEFDKLDRQITQKQDDEKRLRGMLGEYQKRIEAAPKRQSELIELTRDYETFQTSYKSLLAKKEDSNVSANLERRQIGEQFKILDAARMPERPSSPNRPALLFTGLMAGLGVGIALAALVEYLDKRLKSEADVKAALNLMVLATIPVLDGQAKVRVWRVAAISITAFLAATFGAVVLAWRLWK
jgi:polysaccharide chain length determinant protein (PEP-CTERM system associated)